jgi:hypothetical protein
MDEHVPRREPSETDRALVDLVGELESSDYRNSSGVKATQSAAFLNAKALVALLSAIDRRPWWRN